LLQNNPRLGLSVFCSAHPQNEAQWRAARSYDDPILSNPGRAKQVLQLLKSIHPSVPDAGSEANAASPSNGSLDKQTMPLDSGRAMSIFFLESATGISTGRPAEADEFDSLPPDRELEERAADLHDELALLLLEGVIALRRDDAAVDYDTELGALYRRKLRVFLQWPLAKVRSDNFASALPPSFLHEKALILGRLGRHEDALRILYRDLNSLDLALEYCDARHEQLGAREARLRSRMQQQQQGGMFEDYEQLDSVIEGEDNAYLPLVRVALESDDAERGTAAAIQVLALRRSAIDRAAALRLLPSDVPVSAVARPFLIPALVDSESQVRRLTVVSSLLRARYLRLKDQLTTAQLKAQSHLHVVPQLRDLHLGDPLHSTNPFRARTSSQASSAMPDVLIAKHFFPRHLVIQAKVTNSVGLNAKYARTLSDVAFVVAESSEDAIQPMMQVPIHVLPPKMTGCAWCVLSAAPGRMEGPTAQLTCELRYTVQSVEVSSGMAMPVVPGVVSGRTYVEELQDLEVYASHFS
jgi:tetratricopeptide (TPR) repeat protein